MDEADDDDGDGVIDVEKAKAARNSKKNLRKARIELLFNEYEEEIQVAILWLKESRMNYERSIWLFESLNE